jgi:pimeloyl-ACP methyl ester carboxylesterase
MPAWIWEHQIAHFAKTHRVVAMDPRGQGESSKPRDGYFPAARARDIKAVI